MLAPFLVWEFARGVHVPVDSGSIAAVLYSGVFVSLIAYLVWNHCVSSLGATVTSVSYHLVAVFSALMAFVALGEPLQPFHLVGIALILAGFFLATVRRPSNKKMRRDSET